MLNEEFYTALDGSYRCADGMFDIDMMFFIFGLSFQGYRYTTENNSI